VSELPGEGEGRKKLWRRIIVSWIDFEQYCNSLKTILFFSSDIPGSDTHNDQDILDRKRF
jgi:hypothetical protein